MGELAASLPLSLHDQADELGITEFKPPSDKFVLNGELDLGAASQKFFPELIRRSGHEENAQMVGILEAIYAKGRVGWPEGELVQLITAFFPDLGFVTWDILRLLAESGWMDS